MDEEIYRHYAQTVYKFLLARTRDPNLAEELTQETFYQAVRTSARYNGTSTVSTWLCAIAKNVLATYRRRHRQTADLDDDTLAFPSAEQEALAAEDQNAILRRMHALPDPYREILYLRALGGLSFREIGEIFGKSENWARVSFYRGKEKLKKGDEKDEG
ncbi:MAG: sigma-70 family RNA polymerase sigma factor [Oscillospiraceae bacterium]|nr:sigma-70 family RNA polymerase sigma factor [Oscillospiraceae bacterium]